jgi:Periplasmic binding protein
VLLIAKEDDMVRKSGSNRFNRRAFIKASAATGAALAAGSVFAPAVRAAKTVKLGYVSPQTGPLAAFAEANNFIISNFQSAVKGGIKVGSTTYPVEVFVKDSQSNPNRAAEVAKELIVGDKVDLMLAASTPETTNPVSTQCEIGRYGPALTPRPISHGLRSCGPAPRPSRRSAPACWREQLLERCDAAVSPLP